MKPIRALLVCALLLAPAAARGQSVAGRWDLTITDGSERFPSWFEVLRSGDTLAGRFQGRFGHATPITGIVVAGASFRFLWPSESNPGAAPTVLEGLLQGQDSIRGSMTVQGRRATFVGVRAPLLERTAPAAWGPATDMLAAGLGGWRVRQPDRANGWQLRDGVLRNVPPSSDLISRDTFDDFRLTLEVRVPEGGNSGVYLRGRHEVQVQDDYGKPPGPRAMGGIYGQVTPTHLPARPAGQWQTLDITLVGRRVTVVLNGERIVDRAEIPGLTGGALDADEGAPGPIMLQGDHSGIEYRNLRIQRPREGAQDPGLAALQAAERARFAAQVSRDTARLGRMLGEELVYTHSNGLIESRDQFMASVASGGIQYDAIFPVEIAHRVYDSVAVGGGKVRVKGKLRGTEFAVDLLFTNVLVQRGGRWQLVAWQSTTAR